MLKVLSFVLKSTLTLSVLSFFSGSDVSIALIVGQIVAIMAIDMVFRNEDSGVLVVENLREYVRGKEYNEKMVAVGVYMFALSLGAVMFYTVPSFSADTMTIPDIRGLKPFTAETNYMSLEGFVISYCRAHGRDISRGEARMLVKEAQKMGSATLRDKKAANIELAAAPVAKKADIAKQQAELAKEEAAIIAAAKPAVKKACCSTGTGACCAAAAPSIVPAAASRLGVVNYSGRTNDYRHRSLSTVSPAPGRRIERARVAVLPFDNLTQSSEAVEKVYKAVTAEFAKKNYAVVPPEQIRQIVGDVSKLNEGDLEKLAEILEADMIVTGTIKKFARHKRVRLAGLVVGGFITGWHNYGNVEIDTRIFKTAESSYTYQKNVSHDTKDQLMGLFYSSQGARNEALRDTVGDLYKKY